ncbi:hypothetical protein SRABI106_03239 [Rahnella aquatilis]|nr:hypothetical protein SRABI106_03239 [Rahnella aquatilis]
MRFLCTLSQKGSTAGHAASNLSSNLPGGGEGSDFKFTAQAADAQTVHFGDFDLHRNTVFHRLDMADHADGFTRGIQAVERIQRGIQRVGIERTETFVEEQRVDTGFIADQIGQRQGQCQADQEAFAAG